MGNQNKSLFSKSKLGKSHGKSASLEKPDFKNSSVDSNTSKEENSESAEPKKEPFHLNLDEDDDNGDPFKLKNEKK